MSAIKKIILNDFNGKAKEILKLSGLNRSNYYYLLNELQGYGFNVNEFVGRMEPVIYIGEEEIFIAQNAREYMNDETFRITKRRFTI